MPKNTQPIALEPVHRLLLSSSALRVSKKATEIVRKYIQSLSITSSKQAILLSQHAQRTTVMKKDIQLGFKRS